MGHLAEEPVSCSLRLASRRCPAGSPPGLQHFTWQPYPTPTGGNRPLSLQFLSTRTISSWHMTSPSLNCFLGADGLELTAWRRAEEWLPRH